MRRETAPVRSLAARGDTMIADPRGGGSPPRGTRREKGKRNNIPLERRKMVLLQGFLLPMLLMPSVQGVVTFGSDEDSCSQHTPYCETRHGSNAPSESTRFHVLASH